MARDQVGASQVYYDLVRAGRPLNEIIAEGVRIHAPYTHVPYHERIDDGYPNFVNNDHCLLSARATINLAKMLPGQLAMLPMAQTIWYIPSGLDIWNQKINKAPGPLHAHARQSWRGRSAAGAGGLLAGPGAAAPGRPAEGTAQQLDDAGASRPGDRRLPHLPRPDGRQAEPQGGAGRTGVRRADRHAGPACCSTGPTRPATRRIARAPRWRSATRSAGTTGRTTCCTPARWISRSGRAGIRPTRWPATW